MDSWQMKPKIIQDLGVKLAGIAERDARQLIDDYFARITWSMEKEEWDRMTEEQKSIFVRKACNGFRR